MATKAHTGSATILSFPAGGRRRAVRPAAMGQSALELEAMQLDRVDYGSGWYHDAAIRDAGNSHKR